jgi:hypothetical protein
MRPLVAHCHFGLGKLRACNEQRERAVEHLETAVAMFRDMEMQSWCAHAVAVLTRLD